MNDRFCKMLRWMLACWYGSFILQPLCRAQADAGTVQFAMAPVAAEAYPRSVETWLEAQVALARRDVSCGSIDGRVGPQTRAALRAFQEDAALESTGVLDADTRAALQLDRPVLTTYMITAADIAQLQPVSPTWLGKSQQSALDYATVLELVAEQAHAHPAFIRQLNPDVDWERVDVGLVVTIPDVARAGRRARAARVQIHLETRVLQVRDADGRLLAHFPVSIARQVEKRPVGELHVTTVVPNPNYTFDPAVFTESQEGRELGRRLVVPPGPNNPVGVAWIGLDMPGYGIHGTPEPEKVGRTESHGCFRLANWNAAILIEFVRVGTPVDVIE